MTTDGGNIDPMFLQLVMSLEAAALQQMGKLQNPITGKVEKNLDICKSTIDMLEMIEKKTMGNLTQEEESLFKRTLYHLRMNYVDELKSTKEETEKTAKNAPADGKKDPDNGDNPKKDSESDEKTGTSNDPEGV